VPNKYPAFEHHEVVVHTPRHVRSIAELTGQELDLVAEAWRSRAETAAAEGFAYVHACVNEGKEAGASLPHSHSQLVWLREPPPAVTEERGGACRLCEFLERERSEQVRVVAEVDGLLAAAAYAGRFPYETLIAPLEHEDGGLRSELLPAALRLLAKVTRKLEALEGRVPLNAWLHNGGHWHVELISRLSIPAGIELGAGIYVNLLAPEEAATRLRGA
jgi:UDPglucose--hexose-1-phosphate uridylyltransferase